MKKILIASTAAVIATMSFASASYAGSRNNHDSLFNIDVDISFGAKPKRIKERNDFAPRPVQYDNYYEGDDEGCYMKKIRKINRRGELVIKKIQICE